MGAHLIDGEFQSDKYPTTPRGKVPLSVKDPTAQDLLWEYADRREAVDAEFSQDLRVALRTAGYRPAQETDVERLQRALHDLHERLCEMTLFDSDGIVSVTRSTINSCLAAVSAALKAR